MHQFPAQTLTNTTFSFKGPSGAPLKSCNDSDPWFSIESDQCLTPSPSSFQQESPSLLVGGYPTSPKSLRPFDSLPLSSCHVRQIKLHTEETKYPDHKPQATYAIHSLSLTIYKDKN